MLAPVDALIYGKNEYDRQDRLPDGIRTPGEAPEGEGDRCDDDCP